MFGRAYFGGAYFGSAYWGGIAPVDPVAIAIAGRLRKRRDKEREDERKRIEDEQRRLLEELAIAQAISKAEASPKRKLGSPVTLDQIIGAKAVAKMDVQARISLEAKIQTIQRKQRQRREDEELMLMY